MGLADSEDPDLLAASTGGRVVTPPAWSWTDRKTRLVPPSAPDPENGNEVNPAIVDHLEFYLLNYFKPGHDIQNTITDRGRWFPKIGCASCQSRTSPLTTIAGWPTWKLSMTR